MTTYGTGSGGKGRRRGKAKKRKRNKKCPAGFVLRNGRCVKK